MGTLAPLGLRPPLLGPVSEGAGEGREVVGAVARMEDAEADHVEAGGPLLPAWPNGRRKRASRAAPERLHGGAAGPTAPQQHDPRGPGSAPQPKRVAVRRRLQPTVRQAATIFDRASLQLLAVDGGHLLGGVAEGAAAKGAEHDVAHLGRGDGSRLRCEMRAVHGVAPLAGGDGSRWRYIEGAHG